MSSALKRKVSSNFDMDAGVALPKRYRLDPDLPLFQGSDSGFTATQEVIDSQDDVETLNVEPQQSVIVELESEGEPTDANEERALVLYRPATPPVFPGGSSIGSSDFPFRFDTACLQNSKAWDAHGRLSDIFRFKSPVQLEEREDDDGNTGHKQLAMVPWIPPSQHMKSREGSSPTEQIFIPELENQQEMQTTMEEDDTVMMDEDPIQQPHSNSTCTVSANETGTPDAFQWQHLLSAQSPLNPPVMWSC